MLHYKTLRKFCFIPDSHHRFSDTERGGEHYGSLCSFCGLYYHRQAALNPRAHIILLTDVIQMPEGRFLLSNPTVM